MAWTYKHPKSGIYDVGFWYEGFQYRKSTRTRDKRTAGDHAKAVQRAVDAMKSGRDKDGLRLIRHGISVVDVIFPTAKVKRLIDDGDRKPLQLKRLHDLWIKHLADEGRARRTIETTKHRLVDLLDILGDDFRVDYLTKEDLAKYINWRRADGISEYTIKREIGMFKGVINNAVSFEWLSENPVKVWPRLKPDARKEFVPRKQVVELLASNDLDRKEIEDLRSRMLLAAEDLADLVALAERRVPELVVPLAVVGVTGIRRSELVTALRMDVNTDRWTLTVGSGKGSRVRRQVRRTIEIHQNAIPMV